jgi:RNA polymerase primary sigma factor
MIDLLSNVEALSTDYLTIDESLKVDIERSLGVLDPKCREIIKLNYGIGYSNPKSLDEISEKYSLTRERVRQIREKGLRKLRVESRSKILKQYL